MLYIVLVIAGLLIWLGIEMRNSKRWSVDGAAFTLCMVLGWFGAAATVVALVTCTAVYSRYPDDLRSEYQWLVQRHKVDSLIIASGDLKLLENLQTDDYYWSRVQSYNMSVRFWRRYPRWSQIWGSWPDPAPYVKDYPLYESSGDFDITAPCTTKNHIQL